MTKPWRTIRTSWLAIVSAMILSSCGTTAVDESDPSDVEILPFPTRNSSAQNGSEFAASVTGLSREEREKRVVAEITNGNIPDWLRALIPVTYTVTSSASTSTSAQSTHQVTIWVSSDYLSVGSNSDYVLFPMSAGAAQELADKSGTILPTSRIVDEIWNAAQSKFIPQPIPPSPEMTTVPVFVVHNDSIRAQRRAYRFPSTVLSAGHKKDVVLTSRLERSPDKMAIYGWHRLSGDPIQPLYTGHVHWYADYSHGIRLISRRVLIDGDEFNLIDVLRDEHMSHFFSDDGIIQHPRYQIQ